MRLETQLCLRVAEQIRALDVFTRLIRVTGSSAIAADAKHRLELEFNFSHLLCHGNNSLSGITFTVQTETNCLHLLITGGTV